MQLTFTRVILMSSVPLLMIAALGIAAALLLTADDAPILTYTAQDADGQRIMLYDLRREIDWPLAEDAHNPSWSPDGTRIAYTYNGTQLVVQSLPDGDITPLLANGISYSRADWSPDGERIVIARLRNNNRLWLLDPDTPNSAVDLRVEGAAPVWTPDGANIVYYGWNGVPNPALFITSPAGGQRGDVLVPDVNTQFAFTGADDLLFHRDDDTRDFQHYTLYDPATGNETPLLDLPPGFLALHLTLSGDSKQAAVLVTDLQNQQNGLYRMQVEDAPVREMSALHPLMQQASSGFFSAVPQWSPDGAFIAYVVLNDSDAGSQPDIYVVNVDDGIITQITDNPYFDTDPQWRP